MGYDADLAERLRALLAGERGLSEKRMFGGLAFLLDGHMFVGVIGDELMVKLGAEATAAALRREHVRPMDFTGRPAKGAVFVQPGGLVGKDLDRWVQDAATFARTLPPKTTSGGKRR